MTSHSLSSTGRGNQTDRRPGSTKQTVKFLDPNSGLDVARITPSGAGTRQELLPARCPWTLPLTLDLPLPLLLLLGCTPCPLPHGTIPTPQSCSRCAPSPVQLSPSPGRQASHTVLGIWPGEREDLCFQAPSPK